MDNPIREQGSDTQRNMMGLLPSLPLFDGIIKWLASLITLTEQEQEEAGIYVDHMGGE